MKKTLIFVITLLSIFTIVFSIGEFEKTEAVDKSYYASANGLTGDALLEELAEISQANHEYYTSYDDLRTACYVSDMDPNNQSNFLDFYSGISTKGEWDKGITWNREHVWAQSLSGGLFGTNGAGSDVHHVRPTISDINSTRGNLPFGDFDDLSTTPITYKYGKVIVAYYNDTCWEPLDNVKGDIARILMYLYMHYSTEVDANKSYSKAGNLKIQNIVYTNEKTADAAWDLLLKWNKLDPVDSFETARHEYCSDYTSVRNPFIDFPSFADDIWGEGKGTDIDSQIDTYSVTFNVGDKAIFTYADTSMYPVNSLVKEPNITPVLEGYTFDGWYKDTNFTSKWNFSTDKITSNLTLYAKFVEKDFAEIFNSLSIKSQLTFDVIESTSGSGVSTETCTINQFTAGSGSLSKADYNLADYMLFDTSLFDIQYKHNDANNAYISSSKNQIRLYFNASGNGSTIEISAKDGIKIVGVTCTYSSASEATNANITVDSDGSFAKIQNVSKVKNNNLFIEGINITYEIAGSGSSYEIKEGSLTLNYVLELTAEQYIKYITCSNKIKAYIDGNECEYKIVKYGENYRLICSINVANYNTTYIPCFVFENNVLAFSEGYSAKSLAKYYLNNLPSDALVKQYKSCLTEISN